MGAAVERFSGSKLSGLQLYIKGAEDFGHIFMTYSKKITKTLKVVRLFRCVTSLYQYIFVSDKICYHKANSGNSYN